VYDTKSNSWTFSDDIPVKTGACAYATDGNKIYFFGGDKEDYTEIYSICYKGVVNKRQFH
jgi:N-acetylneuraminic acid mutarotase